MPSGRPEHPFPAYGGAPDSGYQRGRSDELVPLLCVRDGHGYLARAG